MSKTDNKISKKNHFFEISLILFEGHSIFWNFFDLVWGLFQRLADPKGSKMHRNRRKWEMSKKSNYVKSCFLAWMRLIWELRSWKLVDSAQNFAAELLGHIDSPKRFKNAWKSKKTRNIEKSNLAKSWFSAWMRLMWELRSWKLVDSVQNFETKPLG